MLQSNTQYGADPNCCIPSVCCGYTAHGTHNIRTYLRML